MSAGKKAVKKKTAGEKAGESAGRGLVPIKDVRAALQKEVDFMLLVYEDIVKDLLGTVCGTYKAPEEGFARWRKSLSEVGSQIRRLHCAAAHLNIVLDVPNVEALCDGGEPHVYGTGKYADSEPVALFMGRWTGKSEKEINDRWREA